MGVLTLILGVRYARQLGRPPATPAAWTLRPTRLAAKPLAMLAIALFWNGIVSVFVTECVGLWRKGDRPILRSLFLLPFIAIGIGIVAAFAAEVLRLFNPRILLVPLPPPLIPGEPAVIAFRGRGRIGRLTQLTFSLVGCETSTGDRDDGRPAMREFHRSVVYELEQPFLMQQGYFRLTLPPDLVKRVAGAENRIAWSLEIKGGIPHWPDLVETYRLVPRSGT